MSTLRTDCRLNGVVRCTVYIRFRFALPAVVPVFCMTSLPPYPTPFPPAPPPPTRPPRAMMYSVDSWFDTSIHQSVLTRYRTLSKQHVGAASFAPPLSAAQSLSRAAVHAALLPADVVPPLGGGPVGTRPVLTAPPPPTAAGGGDGGGARADLLLIVFMLAALLGFLACCMWISCRTADSEDGGATHADDGQHGSLLTESGVTGEGRRGRARGGGDGVGIGQRGWDGAEEAMRRVRAEAIWWMGEGQRWQDGGGGTEGAGGKTWVKEVGWRELVSGERGAGQRGRGGTGGSGGAVMEGAEHRGSYSLAAGLLGAKWVFFIGRNFL